MEAKERAPSQAPVWPEWLAAGALFLIAPALRLYGLGQESLWADEFYTLWTSGGDSVGGVLAEVERSNPHPPLYFVLLHVIIALFGDSPWALRFPSALAGAMAVPFVYMMGRLLAPERRGVAMTLGVLFAISPMHLWYSQEARAYSLQVLLELMTVVALLWAYRSDGRKRIVPLVACALAGAAAASTHFFSAFFLLPVLGGLVYLAWRSEIRWQPAGAAGLLVLLSLPAALKAVGRMMSGAGIDWLPEVPAGVLLPGIPQAQFLAPLYIPIPGWLYYAGLIAALGLFAVGLVEGWRMRRSHPLLFGTVAAGLCCTLVLPVLINLAGKPILFYGQRYLIIALPFTLLVVSLALGSARTWLRYAAWCLVLPVAACQLFWMQNYYTTRQKRTWDTAAAYIDKNAPDAVIAVKPERAAGFIGYYLEPGRDIRGVDTDIELLAVRERPLVIVSFQNEREKLIRAGVREGEIGTLLYETNRPGQDIWLFVLDVHTETQVHTEAQR